MPISPCTTCGRNCRGDTCGRCRQNEREAAEAAERRAELDRIPIPQGHRPRTEAEEAAAAERVAELKTAGGDPAVLSEAAAEARRRHLQRRGDGW